MSTIASNSIILIVLSGGVSLQTMKEIKFVEFACLFVSLFEEGTLWQMKNALANVSNSDFNEYVELFIHFAKFSINYKHLAICEKPLLTSQC